VHQGEAVAHARDNPPVKIEWDRGADAAYISLIPVEERLSGVTSDSVTLEEVAETTGIDALHSIVLGFDRDGKLIGIEVLAPRASSRDYVQGMWLPRCSSARRWLAGSEAP